LLILLLTGLVALIIFGAVIIIVHNHPDFWFWIFLNLYFDPGGYVYAFLGGSLVGSFNAYDVFISGMIICLLSAKTNWNEVLHDQFLKRFLLYLFIFGAYYFIVYGGLVPYFQNDFNYSTFLIKNRTFVYSFIIIIAVYTFSLRSLYYFYTTTLFVGIICLTLFFISLVAGISLAPVEQQLRYTGSEMMRISMINYGVFYLLFPFSLIVYLLSRKIILNLNYKLWLYYAGVIFILAQIITLTRRVQIDIIGTIVIVTLIISYLFRTGKLSSMLKVTIPAILVLITLYFTFPKYVGYLGEVGKDTFLLMTTGVDSKGVGDQRVTGDKDYDLVKEYIKNNLLFGTGYTYIYWKDGRATSERGEKYSRARDAAGEVNIYLLFFGFGILGAIFMLPLYFIMVKLFYRLIKLLKLTLTNYLQDPMLLIFSIYILYVIASKFTYNLWSLSSDFIGEGMSFTAVLMGIGLALHRKVYLNFHINEVQ